jgi:hypothetical protein
VVCFNADWTLQVYTESNFDGGSYTFSGSFRNPAVAAFTVSKRPLLKLAGTVDIHAFGRTSPRQQLAGDSALYIRVETVLA